MRTIILVGLLSIADAINPDWIDKSQTWFYTTIFLLAVITDINEVYLKNKDK